MNRAIRYSPESRERAVRMVIEHQRESEASVLIALGTGIGVALGAGVGTAFGKIAIGAGIGTALGAVAGTFLMVIRGGNAE